MRALLELSSSRFAPSSSLSIPRRVPPTPRRTTQSVAGAAHPDGGDHDRSDPDDGMPKRRPTLNTDMTEDHECDVPCGSS